MTEKQNKLQKYAGKILTVTTRTYKGARRGTVLAEDQAYSDFTHIRLLVQFTTADEREMWFYTPRQNVLRGKTTSNAWFTSACESRICARDTLQVSARVKGANRYGIQLYYVRLHVLTPCTTVPLSLRKLQRQIELLEQRMLQLEGFINANETTIPCAKTNQSHCEA